MGIMNHPAKPPLMPAAQRILLRYAQHNRASLEAFLSLAIDFLDVLDGDPDAEDGTDAEDDFALSAHARDHAAGVPGCEVSDSDATTYLEWHTRGSHKLDGASERLTRNAYGGIGHEDDEDDDPAEDSDSDYCLAGDDRIMGGSVADPDLFRVAHGVGDEADAEDGDQPPYAGPTGPRWS